MERKDVVKDSAIKLGRLLAEHKAGDVKVLDVSKTAGWADYFIIATVSSATQSRGLQRHVLEALKDLSLEIRPTRKKSPDGDDWNLIDLGEIIVHLMTEPARSFYDLEKLMYGCTDLMVGNANKA